MMRFTMKQIEYFVAAAETSSITLAAERVHISQPSVSSAISKLEAEFGMRLFIRHHAQGLSLTPQGQRFLRGAKTLLLQAEELTAAATELSTRVGGVLNIGCLITLYPLLIPELMHAFRKKHAAARIEAIAADQTVLIEHLRNGQISLALTYDLSIPPDMELLPLAVLPPFAFVSARHRLARRKSISVEELAAEPFLLLDLPLSRDYFLSLFHRLGLEPNITGHFQHIEVIRSLVARGEGFGLANAPPRNRTSLDGHPLAYLKLEGNPRPLIHGMMVMKDMQQTLTASTFMTLCRDLVRNDHVPGTV